MNDSPRAGLRLRSEPGVDPEVRIACINFCKWLRTQMEFPIRVVIYLKKDDQIKNRTTKEMVTATFFAPYEKDVEPYIRIATGDYTDLIRERGKIDALYAMLDSIAHELCHYQQWLEDKKLEEEEAEEKGSQLVDEYAENIDSILDF
ncbi:hypothetical protein [Priestia megaterium]|uniref:hypothetical protein n=1 Tax=Priestia megaterium TaxID=1404 RepID=UPI000E2E99D0|nr:hypothetical protein [Priestia megaterium]MCM3196769.1 hypothetical protein [Priestia megaterium]RFB32378.1 hypothetical protein DZB86_30435 [Bacillus sp. RC]